MLLDFRLIHAGLRKPQILLLEAMALLALVAVNLLLVLDY